MNWRQHQLLPKPQARGRGRGKGKAYFYSDLSVIRQICAVEQLLNSVGRLNELYVPLWLLGYEVDYRLARRQMTAYIKKLLRDLTRGAKSLGVVHMEDHFFELARRLWREMQNAHILEKYSVDSNVAYFSPERISIVLLALLMSEIALTDLSPDDEEERAPMIQAFQARWYGRSISEEEAIRLARGFTPQLRALREYALAPALLSALKRATKDDWVRTQSFIRNCARYLWAVYRAYKTDPPDPYAPSERAQCGKALLHFGRISVAIGLVLVQRGRSENIESTIGTLSRSMVEGRRPPV
ncbi:MAG: hypothetical protein MOB07_11845 [Acidobacteria bacterium]|nr:hypothetical protein [Acidobacteriota bacterium]